MSSIHDLYRRYYEAGLLDETEYEQYAQMAEEPAVEEDFFEFDEPDGTDDAALPDAELEAIRRGESSIPDRDAADRLVDSVSAVMVAVATGGPRIDDVKGRYQREFRALRAVLARLDINNPNPFDDLWRWYGKWSDGSLPTYVSRRTYVANLYAPVRAALDAQADRLGEVAQPIDDTGGATGWVAVDRKLGRLRRLFREGEDTDDAHKQIALQCVSILQATGRAVFDQELHLPNGEELPHRDDAKNQITYFLNAVAPGKDGELVRKLVRTTWSLAQQIKHRAQPSRTDAGIIADSTTLLVSILRRLADAAEPESPF